FAPSDVLKGGPSTAGGSLGALPPQISVTMEPTLQLETSMRAFRSPNIDAWVASVLSGDSPMAKTIAGGLTNYPIVLTRSLRELRAWLKVVTRGERRCGLVASSGARRLRADGVGEILNASDGAD